MKKRDATRQKGPSLKFSRVSCQTAKSRKSDFRRRNFGESHVCKENRVQNIVFLRVCDNKKIKRYGTKVARRPETDFLRSRVRDKLLPRTGSPLDFGPKKDTKIRDFSRSSVLTRSRVRDRSQPPTTDLRQLPVGTIFGNREYETNLSRGHHWNAEYETNRRMDPAQIVGRHPNTPFFGKGGLRTGFYLCSRGASGAARQRTALRADPADGQFLSRVSKGI